MISKILIAGFCNTEPVFENNILKFGVHCFENYMDVSGNEKPVTDFYTIQASGEIAVYLYERLKIGTPVYCDCRLTSELILILNKIEFGLKSAPEKYREFKK